MEIFESCNAVRKTLNKTGLHYFVKESPFSLWISIRKKRIVTNEFVENDHETSDKNDKDLEIESLKEKLIEREIEVKTLKISSRNLKASAKNYAKQVKNKDHKIKLLEEEINQTLKVAVTSQTKSDASHQFDNVSVIDPITSIQTISTNMLTNPISGNTIQSNFTTSCLANPTYQTIPYTNVLVSSTGNLPNCPRNKFQSNPLNTTFSVTPTDIKPWLDHQPYPQTKVQPTNSFQMNLKTFPDSSINTNNHNAPAFVGSESPEELKKHFIPFSCELCGARFLKLSNVDFHMNRLHKTPNK